MNSSRQTLALARALARNFSKTPARNTETVHAKFQQLKKSQEKFGVHDNVPSYLKGGLGDKLLFQGTALLTLVALGMSLETFYKLAIK